MADRTAAAIRRASAQARHAMEQLDSTALDELERIYGQAADDVRAAVLAASAAGGTDQVELAQLRDLLRHVEAVLDALARARNGVVEAALVEAAQLGARPFSGAGLVATGAAVGQVAEVLSAPAVVEVVDTAVNFVRTFRAADGLSLSDRLWRVDRGAKDAVLGMIEQAVVQGWSADKAAAELAYRGQPVPAATREAQAAADATRLVRAGDVLRDTAAGPLANTLRVARTEINRAHGEAYMASAAQAPGFLGFRFLLSPAHPRPDICDLLARQNLHGLGRGVYPTREKTPWPAHPNTLSFLVAVFEDELTDADRDGQETTLEALQRLAPEIREGVLGPTKADYFDQGLLTRGMVRAKVGTVQQRLRRTGRIG